MVIFIMFVVALVIYITPPPHYIPSLCIIALTIQVKIKANLALETKYFLNLLNVNHLQYSVYC